VRNALTALPLLQSYLAALILGESVAATLSGVRARTAVLFTALALTAAGFLVPVFASYSHMEGAGRQVAIAFMALLPVILCTERKQPIAAVVLTATTLVALAALNPVNALVPCLLVALVAVHGLLRRERSGWLILALPLMLLCVLLDPYYQALLQGDSEAARITLSGRLHVKTVAEILVGWQWQLAHRLPDFVGGQMAMTPRNPAPLFGVFALGLLVGVWMLRRRRRIAWSVLVVAAAAVAALFAADALFAAVADDRRFYLLSPYFRFSLLQHRILLLVALGALLMRTAATRGLSGRAQLALGAALVVVLGGAMRLVQPMSLEPRWSECGSLGCITVEDEMVMHAFAYYAAKGGVPAGARVLVPNSLHHAAHEEWIFPVDGARALPFATPVPVAFYYYQGDAAFTTDAYLAHVCHGFDRAWLRAQRVGYVFLPASRGSACMQGVEALPGAEHVLFHSGRAYLLELR
jgi:hypothetical protein